MVRRKIHFLISVTVIAACIRNSHSIYDYDKPKLGHNINKEISVVFPKYNIKIAPPEIQYGPQLIYEEMPSGYDDYNQIQELEPSRLVHENNYDYVQQENQPIYQTAEQLPIYETVEHSPVYQSVEQLPVYQTEPEQYPIYQSESEQFPIISRVPIEIMQPYHEMYSYARSSENNEQYNPEVGIPKSRKHNNDWFYTAPTWNSNSNMNILREADPRSIVSSHTHFVKIKKPIFGNKVIFSHSKKIIGDDHDFHQFGGHEHYIGGHDRTFGNHFRGGNTNINKNTHIHVHNRNANTNKVERETNEKDNEQIIGSHLFAAPRWRRDIFTENNKAKLLDGVANHKREERSITGLASDQAKSVANHKIIKRSIVDLARLVSDHKVKLDLQKTAENVGAATRNVFEEDYSPIYHFTNALGAAHDCLYSAMNVRPSGILIPSGYRIVHANDIPSVASSSPIVGGINPAIYNLHDQTPPPTLSDDDSDTFSPSLEPTSDFQDSSDNYDNQYIDYDNNGDPLQLIGNKLRESVQWAHRSAGHAADAFHHAREMFVTARQNWPKLLLPFAGALEIAKPKLGEPDNDIVGTVKDPEYIGLGKMMDYFGMTDRKPDLTPRVGGPRMISEEEMILKKAKDVLGAPTYKHFLDEMRRHLDIHPAKSENVGSSRLFRPIPKNLQTKLALDRLRSALLVQKARANLRKLQKPSIIPKPAIKPLKNPLLKSPEPKIQPLKPPETLGVPQKTVNKSNPTLDKIRKAIEAAKKPKDAKIPKIITSTTAKPPVNPLEKLRSKLYEKYNIPNDKTDHTDILGKTLDTFENKNPEQVGAPPNTGNLPLTKEMNTPFMGLATKKDLEQYFKKLYCSNCKMEDIK